MDKKIFTFHTQRDCLSEPISCVVVYKFSEEYYSESEDDDDDNNSRSSSRCSTPSNIGTDSLTFTHGAEVGSAGNYVSLAPLR